MTKPTLAIALAIAASAAAVAQDDDFSKVEIKAVPVAGTVTMLEGAGGNIGVSAGPDGVLIVDDQFAPLADKIRAAIGAIKPGKIAFLVNTHWHGDHTGGNGVFGKEATIVAQENVRKRLSSPDTGPGRRPGPVAKEALPVVTFEHDVTIWFNGEEIAIHHLPHGHTDGDSAIVFKGSKVVHMGDQFFNGMFPFIDTDSGGDVEGYIKNLGDMVAACPPGAKIIPGHGPLATLDDMKKEHAMLVATSEIVKKRIAAGMSLDDAKKAGLPDEWKKFATGFMPAERWIETLYRNFTKS